MYPFHPLSLDAFIDLGEHGRLRYAERNLLGLLLWLAHAGDDEFSAVAAMALAIYKAANPGVLEVGVDPLLITLGDETRIGISSRVDAGGADLQMAWIAAASGTSIMTAAALAEIDGVGIAIAELRPIARAPSTLVRGGRLAADAAAEGIYIIRRGDGMIYVGQSADIDRRLLEHLNDPRKGLTLAEVQAAQRIAVPGGRVAREIAEQLMIRDLGPIGPGSTLINARNAIGPARVALLQTFRNVDEYLRWLEYHRP